MWQIQSETCISCKPSLHLQHVALLSPLYIYLTHTPHHHHITITITSSLSLHRSDGRPRPSTAAPYPSHPQQHHRYEGGVKSLFPQKGPSTGQIIALITLLPISGALLGLAGIILVGTLIGLAVATPLFVIFSPVFDPAAILVAGAVTAFLTSGAFELTGLSSLLWLLNSFRQSTGQEPLDYAKRHVQEGTVYVGKKTKQAGEAIKSKGQEVAEAGLEDETRRRKI